MEYDPSVISYRELIDLFWNSHDPSHASWSRQYRAAIFYHNDEQKLLAEAMRNELASESGREIRTAIEPYTGFTLAEDYHQKHGLRMFHQIMSEYRIIYPDMQAFLHSIAVTRVNGYLGGYGSCDALRKDIMNFGLSCEAQEILLSVVCNRKISLTCAGR